MSEASVERLRELAALGRLANTPGTGNVADPLRLGDAVRVRRVAMTALSTISGLGSEVLEGAMARPGCGRPAFGVDGRRAAPLGGGTARALDRRARRSVPTGPCGSREGLCRAGSGDPRVPTPPKRRPGR